MLLRARGMDWRRGRNSRPRGGRRGRGGLRAVDQGVDRSFGAEVSDALLVCCEARLRVCDLLLAHAQSDLGSRELLLVLAEDGALLERAQPLPVLRRRRPHVLRLLHVARAARARLPSCLRPVPLVDVELAVLDVEVLDHVLRHLLRFRLQLLRLLRLPLLAERQPLLQMPGLLVAVLLKLLEICDSGILLLSQLCDLQPGPVLIKLGLGKSNLVLLRPEGRKALLPLHLLLLKKRILLLLFLILLHRGHGSQVVGLLLLLMALLSWRSGFFLRRFRRKMLRLFEKLHNGSLLKARYVICNVMRGLHRLHHLLRRERHRGLGRLVKPEILDG
mmetsp:Transcript_33250/g.78323  ORF Transcript_33250/g.78323 Transcript_33250/m.78323 type:complete len:332 (-) Transcript_33250:150-1145(-)